VVQDNYTSQYSGRPSGSNDFVFVAEPYCQLTRAGDRVAKKLESKQTARSAT